MSDLLSALAKTLQSCGYRNLPNERTFLAEKSGEVFGLSLLPVIFILDIAQPHVELN